MFLRMLEIFGRVKLSKKLPLLLKHGSPEAKFSLLLSFERI